MFIVLMFLCVLIGSQLEDLGSGLFRSGTT
jgi:hypothetical protein